MQKQIELRREVDQIERRGRGRRFPEPLRSKLLNYIRTRRSAGDTLKKIGEEIGLDLRTVSRWLGDKQQSGRLKRVQVVDDRPARAMTVHGPCGVRVEGVAVEDLADLLRRLG